MKWEGEWAMLLHIRLTEGNIVVEKVDPTTKAIISRPID